MKRQLDRIIKRNAERSNNYKPLARTIEEYLVSNKIQNELADDLVQRIQRITKYGSAPCRKNLE